jgi:spermidine/putrescine transport system substrate-binding protein
MSYMRKFVTALAGALVLASIAVVAGCGGGDSGSGGSASSGSSGSSSKGGTLTVLAWKSYGADDPWAVQQFEKETGAKVKFVYMNSEDGMLQTLQQGGVGKIDVALPNLEYVQPGVSRGLFQPIDQSKVTTWNELSPQFTKLPSLRSGGQLYAVPWVQGATSLAVNPDVVKPAPDSWSVLWDSGNRGKVAYYDDPTTAIMTAALYLGEDPQNPNLDKVRDALQKLKANTKVFWASADDWTKPYSSHAITMGNLWSGLAGTLKANGQPVDFIFPKEGTVRWGDNWSIVKDAPNVDLAYKWINFMTSKKYFVHWISKPGPNQQLAVPVNMTAVQALPKHASDKLSAGRLTHYTGPAAFQAGIPLDRLQQWTQLWEEIKAGG